VPSLGGVAYRPRGVVTVRRRCRATVRTAPGSHRSTQLECAALEGVVLGWCAGGRRRLLCLVLPLGASPSTQAYVGVRSLCTGGCTHAMAALRPTWSRRRMERWVESRRVRCSLAEGRRCHHARDRGCGYHRSRLVPPNVF